MKSLGTLLATLCLVALPASSLAGEHPLSSLTGSGIDLKTYDHAFAGSIKDFVAWGFVDEENFTSELVMRRDGQTIKALFAKQADGTIGGTISHLNDSKLRETSLRFVSIDKPASKIILNINGEQVAVSIQSDGFENGHFKNPSYKTVINGEAIEYTLHGSACFSYSLHLAFLILGAYTH